jgi:hypothetical protein
MTDARSIKHEAVPNCGSYEVRYSDGRPSFEDVAGRRLRPEQFTSEQAEHEAKKFAQAANKAANGSSAWNGRAYCASIPRFPVAPKFIRGVNLSPRGWRSRHTSPVSGAAR